MSDQAKVVDPVWLEKARSVSRGIGRFLCTDFDDPDQANVFISAMRSLLYEDGCPDAYPNAAQGLVADGVWGDKAEEVHQILRGI